MPTVLTAGIVAAAAVLAAQPALLTLPTPIEESSGVATSSRSAEWFFTHEDSGAPAQFSAVGVDGRLLATYTLPGVQARDWEDMARGPDEHGNSSLWLGDIGDNSASRDGGLLVHRVPEPTPDLSRTDVRVTTSTPVSFRLRYDDGPRDAETLLVHPRTGRLYVVTKPLGVAPRVYAAPEVLDPDGPNMLSQVGAVTLRRTGSAGGPGIGSLAQVLLTGGDIAPDGSRLALRTYTDLYEWPLDDDLGAAVSAEPAVTPLPSTLQGEGVAYTDDGSAMLLTSEGPAAPVHRIPAAELAGTAATSPSAAAGAQGDEGGTPERAPGALVDRRAPVVAAALLVGLLGWWLVRRGRPRAPR